MVTKNRILVLAVFLVAAVGTYLVLDGGTETPLVAALVVDEGLADEGAVSPLTDAARDNSVHVDGAGMEGFEPSTLRMLDHLHGKMLAEGLPLVAGEVSAVQVDDNEAILSIRLTESVWSPSGVDFVASSAISKVRWLAPTEDLEKLSVPVDALLVISDDQEVLGLAVFESEASKVELPGASPLFLTAIAEQLHNEPISLDVAPVDSCATSERLVSTANAREALVAYFETFGETERTSAVAARAAMEATAEQLVLNADLMVDSVTGWVLTPSQQDIEYQLADGRAANDVEIRPALPMQIRVASESSAEVKGLVAVFASSSTGRALGFTVLSPHLAHDDKGNPVPVLDRVLEIVPPDPGDDIAVYVRSMETDLIECSQGPDEKPIMVIPYETAAGARTRVLVDFATNAFTPVEEFVAPTAE